MSGVGEGVEEGLAIPVREVELAGGVDHDVGGDDAVYLFPEGLDSDYREGKAG